VAFRRLEIIPPMRRVIAALALVACLAFAFAGCGSDDDDSGANDQTTAAAGGAQTTGDATSGGGSNDGKDEGGEAQGAGPAGSGSGGGNDDSGPFNPEQLAKEFEAPPGGDDSIQTFGEEAEGDEKEEVVSAMRSFFRAMASGDPERVCAALSKGNVEQFELFLKAQKEEGDCTTVLAKFLGRQKGEAERAVNGQVYQVRVEDENAFVMFIPEGGTASYFVMKREDDGWKSTTVSTGTSFDPVPPQTSAK
jgi:hypothetical protein